MESSAVGSVAQASAAGRPAAESSTRDTGERGGEDGVELAGIALALRARAQEDDPHAERRRGEREDPGQRRSERVLRGRVARERDRPPGGRERRGDDDLAERRLLEPAPHEERDDERERGRQREREARRGGGERDPERPRHGREAARRGEPAPRARALLLGDAPAALAEEDEERLVGDEREDDRRRERRGGEPRPADGERREERHRELPPRAVLVREHRSRWGDGTGGRALGGRGRGHGGVLQQVARQPGTSGPCGPFPPVAHALTGRPLRVTPLPGCAVGASLTAAPWSGIRSPP